MPRPRRISAAFVMSNGRRDISDFSGEWLEIPRPRSG
jgi:hypothetical protein